MDKGVVFYDIGQALSGSTDKGGLLPDIILLTQCYYYHRGTRLNTV